MNIGEKRPVKIGFPIGLYLKQVFSIDPYVRYINPFSFWRRYKINHLETCGELNTVQYLESCYKLDRLVKHTKVELNRDYTDTSINSLLKQAQLNTIYISQPRIKLKYRGVSYYTKDILNININVVKVDPSAVNSDSLKCADDHSNTSNPDFSGSNW